MQYFMHDKSGNLTYRPSSFPATPELCSVEHPDITKAMSSAEHRPCCRHRKTSSTAADKTMVGKKGPIMHGNYTIGLRIRVSAGDQAEFV